VYAAGAAGILLATAIFLDPKSGVTKANFDRITPEMDQAHVQALLGAPPRLYPDSEDEELFTCGPPFRADRVRGSVLTLPPNQPECWVGQEGTIVVVFGPSGKAGTKYWYRAQLSVEQDERSFDKFLSRAKELIGLR
jgi:hypothetical protein